MAQPIAQENPKGSSFLGSSIKGLLLAAGAMAVANLGRKLAVQAPTAMADDWCAGLIKEHKATLALIDKLQQVSGDQPARRTALLAGLKHALTKHALQEEQVIYPMLRRHSGAETADVLNSDHGSVKAALYELGHMDKAAPAFAEILSKLRSDLEIHMREEEETLFPNLRNALSTEENSKLSREMNMAGLMLA